MCRCQPALMGDMNVCIQASLGLPPSWIQSSYFRFSGEMYKISSSWRGGSRLSMKQQPMMIQATSRTTNKHITPPGDGGSKQNESWSATASAKELPSSLMSTSVHVPTDLKSTREFSQMSWHRHESADPRIQFSNKIRPNQRKLDRQDENYVNLCGQYRLFSFITILKIISFLVFPH